MTDLERVTALCRKLGAAPEQAATMARQLLKRSEQLASERGCSHVEAMEYLLRLTIQGASGEAPPGFEGGVPPADKPEANDRC
ncbi:hypothetical protein [Synoicihabitans lomoniglobus]|uniref:Uncharacterized protein n=1 Tax=Synoicihabitans lomoniglobus TaxID=2909285 RepID=A0AAF0A137_9BACT|nr:hypothetical protein [Opitutaceae bacterium LMO-M01]WED65428.1 hypothetical protein PXH66_01015 [Opitutaceae bacterium LMO-M01]